MNPTMGYQRPESGIPVMLTILFAITILSRGSNALGLSTQQCSALTEADDLVIEPAAEAFITTLLGVNAPNAGGEGCGDPSEVDMQSFEAMRWALQTINQDSGSIYGIRVTDSYIPGVKLGIKVLETCTSPSRALVQLQKSYPELFTIYGNCNQTDTINIGVLGPMFDDAARTVAGFLGDNGVPIISAAARDPELSDRVKYPTFARTVSSNKDQIKVLSQVLLSLEWKHIAIVYTNDKTSKQGYEMLVDQLNMLGICVAYSLAFSSESLSSEDLQTQWHRLAGSGVKAAVFYGQPSVAMEFLSLGDVVPGAGEIQWLFSEDMAGMEQHLSNVNFARGILTIKQSTRNLPEFETHWIGLDEHSPPSDNPWFQKWYMQTNLCNLPGVDFPPYSLFYPECPELLENDKRDSFVQSSYAEHMVASVYTYARALKEAHIQLCGGTPGLCDALKTLSPLEFHGYFLDTLDFTFTNAERIPSLASNNVPPFNAARRIHYINGQETANLAYSILNFNNQQNNDQFSFQQVGIFIGDELDFNIDGVTFYDSARNTPLNAPPEALCSPNSYQCSKCIGTTAPTNRYIIKNVLDGHSADCVVGIALPIHKKGASPTMCGQLDYSSVDLLQAFIYATGRISHSVSTPIGYFIIDDCNSPTSAQSTLDMLLSDHLLLADEIVAMVSDRDEVTQSLVATSSAIVNAVFTSHLIGLQKPIVNGGLSCDTDSKAVSLLMKRFGWTYARVMIDDPKQVKYVDKLRDNGAGLGICIGNPLEVYGSTTQSSLMDNLKGTPDAHVLIINKKSKQMALDKVIRTLNTSALLHQYIFIVPSTLSSKAINKLRTVAKSVIQMQIDSPPTAAYAEYLADIDVLGYTENPWFQQWYEHSHQCYLDATNHGAYNVLCDSIEDVSITESASFSINPDSYYLINLIDAIGRGVDATISTVCPGNHTHCDAFISSPNRVALLRANMKEAIDAIHGGYKFVLMTDVNIQLARYSASTDSFSDVVALSELDNLASHQSSCGSTCFGCSYLYSKYQNYITSNNGAHGAHINIAGVFDIHQSNEDSPIQCSDRIYHPSLTSGAYDGYQLAEAMLLAVDNVNRGRVPVLLNSGVTLGAILFDTCDSGLRGSSIASSVYSGGLELDDARSVQGWVTTGDQQTIEVARVLGELSVPVVSSTGSSDVLSDNMFPTLHTLSASQTSTSKAISQFLLYMDWRYVHVIHGSTVSLESFSQTFAAHASQNGICLLSSNKVESDTQLNVILRDIALTDSELVVLFLSRQDIGRLLEAKAVLGASADRIVFVAGTDWGPSTSIINAHERESENTIIFQQIPSRSSDFLTHFQNIPQNPGPLNAWYRDYHEQMFSCDTKHSFDFNIPCNFATDNVADLPTFEEEIGVPFVMNSVYTIAMAVHRTLITQCGANYQLVCSTYTDSNTTKDLLLENMANVKFFGNDRLEYGFTNRQAKPAFVITKIEDGEYKRVGSVLDNSLRITETNLQTDYSDTRSSCGAECQTCQRSTTTQEDFFVKENGHINIAGIFDIHTMGTDSYSCGSFNNKQGYQLLEAFNFAIDRINSRSGIFSDKLRGVTLGAVGMDSCQSPLKASTLVSNIHGGNVHITNGGEEISPDRIDAYVGGFTSDVSRRVADVLNTLGIPQVSYGASETKLGDDREYPLFLRTVPGDSQMVDAVIALLESQRLDYIQVIYSDSIYGNSAKEQLVAMVGTRSICIAQTLHLDMSSVDQVVEQMVSKDKATTVVLILDSADINPFLQAALRSNDASRYNYVATSTWSNDLSILRGVDSVASGTVTLGDETADVPEFDRYLETIQPGVSGRNPWTDAYFEELFQCSMSPGSGRYTTPCEDVLNDIPRAPRYQQDPYVIYTINAVFSVAFGIDHALTTLCGSSYTGACQAYFSSNRRHQLIVEGMKEARFTDFSNQMFFYNDQGESSRGFHIYVLRSQTNVYYENIGNYNHTHGLKVNTQFATSWNSTCRSGGCAECPVVAQSQVTRSVKSSNSADMEIVNFLPVHRQTSNGFQCGEFDSSFGFQSGLAFYYAIQQLNDNNLGSDSTQQFPITLGGTIIDTCGNTARVSGDMVSLFTGEPFSGTSVRSSPKHVVAFMTASPEDANAVEDIVGFDNQYPVVSTVDTSEKLPSNNKNYLRSNLVNPLYGAAVADFVTKLGWHYVSVVQSSDSNSKSGANAFFNRLTETESESTVCPGQHIELPKSLTISESREVIRSLVSLEGAPVVVLFTSGADTELLIKATKDLDREGDLIWVASESWDVNRHLFNSHADVTRGALILSLSDQYQPFNEYVASLSPEDHGDIPTDWFQQFWQTYFECRLPGSRYALNQYERVCRNQRIDPNTFVQSPNAFNTILATSLIGRGLANRMLASQCDDSSQSVSDCLRGSQDAERQLADSIRNARTTLSLGQQNTNNTYRFNTDGFIDMGVTLLNLQESDGLYNYVNVGEWSTEDGATLKKNTIKIYRRDGQLYPTFPTSQCPPTQSCGCVLAGNVSSGEFGGMGDFRRGTQSGTATTAGTSELTGEVDMHYNFTKVWGIIVIALTAVGILATLFLFIYLLIFYPVRGGTSVLGYLLLVGVMLVFVLNFAFILRANENICEIRRFCLGLVYAICFSALMVKVLNTWRLDTYKEGISMTSKEYENLSHPVSLFLIALGIASVQIIIGVQMAVLDPAKIEVQELLGELTPRCATWDFHNTELVLTCIYVMILILVTLMVSAITWKSEVNNHESRWILGTCCITVGIWGVWGVMSTWTDYEYREPAITVANLLNGAAILIIIFGRKIYLLSRYQEEIAASEKQSSLYNQKVNGLYGSEYPNSTIGGRSDHTSRGLDGNGTIGHRSTAGSYAGSRVGGQVVVGVPQSRVGNGHPVSYAGSDVGGSHIGTNGGNGVMYVYGTAQRDADQHL